MAGVDTSMYTGRKVRIGMVNFINTAPLYDVWLRTVNRPDWSVVEASPSVLNRMLYADQLDMGLVSSQEYGAHPENYILLDDISISASGPVGSVFIFSRCEPEYLTDRLVLLSGQSQTSVSLVKIILEDFYKVKPFYEIGAVLDAQLKNNISGVLAIGDEALILAQNKIYPHKIDLGKIWHEETSLPFVFAVWAMQAEFCRMQPEIVREIHQELLRCRQAGKDDLRNICRRVSPRVSMEADACYEYLRGIEHDLGPEKKKGLIRFIEYLIERGEGTKKALPLKLFSETIGALPAA
jgi:chorismate dehydratase